MQINHCCQCWLRLYLFKTVKLTQQYSYPASGHTWLTALPQGLNVFPEPSLIPSCLLGSGEGGRGLNYSLRDDPFLVTEGWWKLHMNNSLSCLLCIRFHPWSWGWKGDQAQASHPSCTAGASNTLLVVDLLTSNQRAWTMVCDRSWKFHRFKLSQAWEDISISSPRFFPVKCGLFLHPPFNFKEVSCKIQV